MSNSSQLRRSQKTEFNSSTGLISRERSFIKPNKDPQKRRSQHLNIKGKPTLEIYRPPNVRSDLILNNKLNVHAKEFTMGLHELQNSKSATNLAHMFDGMPLQHSKSSGNLLRHPLIPIIPPMSIPILHSNSLIGLPRVNFQLNDSQLFHYYQQQQQFQQQQQQHQQHQQQQQQHHHHHHQHHNNVKRSKSLNAADSRDLAAKLKGISIAEENELLALFPVDDQSTIKAALEDTNQLASRTLMDLVKIILDRVVEGIRYAEPGAKLCMSIIEKEKTQTFLESLLNTTQQWYQERDKKLRGIKAGDGTRFSAFMWFLTEMCGQLKRHRHRNQHQETHADNDAVEPDLVLLSVLAKCCHACVSLPIQCLAETECLFFVLTSIGRDLENELPLQLECLLASVRDGFLATAGSPPIRRTLLQLIELHASNWQLPGSSVLYYYPRIK